MYRIVVSDMDETFLNHEHKIPERNIAALKRMRELGLLFVPSSGRGYLSIMDNFDEVDPELMAGSFVVSYNGATINRFGEPEPLQEACLPHELADELWRVGIEMGAAMHAYTPDCRILVRNLPEDEEDYLSTVKRIYNYPEPDLTAEAIVSKLLYMSHDAAFLDKIAQRIAPLIVGAATLTWSSGRYLEVIPIGHNKGTGLVRLCELLGISIDEVIAIGDSANDAEMIQAAGFGVGVANVTDDLRPHCQKVLTTTCEDGALEELVAFIEEENKKALV